MGSQGDLFGSDTQPVAPAAVMDAEGASNSFPSIAAAQRWMDRNGWKPRHGGGYEVGGRLFGIMVATGIGEAVRLQIEGKSSQ